MDGFVFLESLAQGVAYHDAVLAEPLLFCPDPLDGQLLGLQHQGHVLDAALLNETEVGIGNTGGNGDLGAHGHENDLL